MQRSMLLRHPRPIYHGLIYALMAALPAWAEQVKLTTLDQSFSIEGDLVEFDGTVLKVQTTIGEMVIERNRVLCEGPGCPQENAEGDSIVLAGDTFLASTLVPRLLAGFAADNQAEAAATESPNIVTLDLQGGAFAEAVEFKLLATANNPGFEALLAGAATGALSSRLPRSRETREFEEAELGLLTDSSNETIVALDAMVLIVNPENPVRSVSEDEAARIFAGEINNWSELGGPDAPIAALASAAGSPTTSAFESQVMRPARLEFSGTIAFLETEEELVEAVLADPNAIALAGFGASKRVPALAISGECGLTALPTEFSVKAEDYPLTKYFYLFSSNRPASERFREFRAYLSSDTAQSVIADAGLIDQSVTYETIDSQGLRLASAILANETAEDVAALREMVRALFGFERLSTTFRFNTGTTQLTTRSQADMARLARLLESGVFGDREFVFVGFTDSIGNDELNRQLSVQRAQDVLDTLIALNPDLEDKIRTRILGYGEISPLACNESASGRQINRRVEVWIGGN
jgi:phosphate transport system substrate-binding protein